MSRELPPQPFAERPAALRFDAVDFLRGLSIIAVILLHGHLSLLFASHSIQSLLPRWLFQRLFTNGGNGVTVFFAISGFLITLTSLRRFGTLARMRMPTFYRIRFARIAPLLLLLLVALSMLHLMHADGFRISSERTTLLRALFAALTFHVNWLEATRGFLPPNWDVLWSLSIEEMFYLFFPLTCLALLRWRRGMLPFVAMLLIFVAMGPFARTVWSANEIWLEKSYLGGMDGIALGCLTALLTYWLQRRPMQLDSRLVMSIQICGASLMLLIVIWPRWHWMRYLGRSGAHGTVLSLGTCLVMLATVIRGRSGRTWSGPVRWFGRYSYEIYLTHEFVVVWLTTLYLRIHRGPLLAWVAAMLLLSAPLGALVARFISEPLNGRLRGAAIPSSNTGLRRADDEVL